MPTPTTHTDPPRPLPTLHVALDLGNTGWCLAGAPAVAAPPRVRMFPDVLRVALAAEVLFVELADVHVRLLSRASSFRGTLRTNGHELMVVRRRTTAYSGNEPVIRFVESASVDLETRRDHIASTSQTIGTHKLHRLLGSLCSQAKRHWLRQLTRTRS